MMPSKFFLLPLVLLLRIHSVVYLYELFCLSEHLGLALALNVPVFVVVTKIDMCPPNVLQDTMKLLARILKSPGCRKIPVIVQNTDDVVVSATNFVSERYVHASQVSLVLNTKFACYAPINVKLLGGEAGQRRGI